MLAFAYLAALVAISVGLTYWRIVNFKRQHDRRFGPASPTPHPSLRRPACWH